MNRRKTNHKKGTSNFMCRIEKKEFKLDIPTNYMMRGKKVILVNRRG